MKSKVAVLALLASAVLAARCALRRGGHIGEDT